MKISEKVVREALTEVLDPELNISIVDLGLIYDIEFEGKDTVKVTMTLTTIGCPLFALIEQEIKNKLSKQGIPSEKIKLNLTFDPPWNMGMLSERAKAMLGM